MSARTDMDLVATAVEPLAVLAHELRNPIGAIRNAVMVMETAWNLPGAMEHARRLIARQAGQLAVLVDDLMDLASFARGTLRLHREWVDIIQEVEVAVESCGWALGAAGQALSVDIPDGQFHAYVDRVRLRQIITNLLDNACKYTPAFGRIRICVERDENRVVLGVNDNGVGIAKEDLPYVFDLFSRTDNARETPIRGLGVGLTLVRELAELHGGDVRAMSDGAGCGSTFVVRLPVCPDSVVEHQP